MVGSEQSGAFLARSGNKLTHMLALFPWNFAVSEPKVL